VGAFEETFSWSLGIHNSFQFIFIIMPFSLFTIFVVDTVATHGFCASFNKKRCVHRFDAAVVV
jgi:hypothetical protein